MTSGIYGRRVVEPQISDHSLFLDDRFLKSGADRKLSSELENVWDKVSDAKAVLQKLEHRMEVTEDANKAENLAFKMTPVSLPKNASEKVPSIRAVTSVLRDSPAVKGSKQMSTSNRTNNHKVAFHEPLVLYHEDFGPVPAGRLVSTRSPLHSNSNSFIVRDLRSNDFDVSRVTMRDKTGTVQSGVNLTGFSADETITPTKGTVIPPRVLNDPSKNVSNLKSKPGKSGRDLKSAGVARTVTHFDPKQVYKYLEKESVRKHSEKTNHRGKDVGRHAPLLLDSPYAPYKRIDIVKQKKGLQQNSEALARLKEKIQKQKERSPSSMDSSLAFAYSSTHKEDDPIAPNDSATGESKEKPRMRKIAQGPAAPKYKGFSAAETKIRTPDGKVWKPGEENNPYIPTRVFPDGKKSRAVSSLFNDNKGKSKPGLSLGRLKGSSMIKAKSSQSKNQRLVRKTGKICPEDPAHKKSLITPSSWREGQKVAESILGPPPKHRKKTTEKDLKRPFSPPTHDTDLHSHKKLQSHTTSSKRPDIGNTKSAADASSKSNKNTPANFIQETGTEINEHNGLKINDELVDSHAHVRAQPTKSGTSIKASIPREKLSPSVQGILDDLHLSSSDSDEESTTTEKDEQAKEPAKIQHSARGRSGVSRKNLLYKDSKPSSENKAPKVRHYNQNQVQQYIAKQKADRKRKQSQERKNEREAQERRQKQLKELYRKQKDAAVAKKKLSEAGKNRPVLQDSYVKSSDTTAAQAMQKINDILTEPSGWRTTNTDSDKENTQEFQQPSSKFDEKMSAFMEKLNQYEDPSETMTETERKTPVEHVIAQDKDKGSSQAPIYSSTSEFMQKLDRYLNDEGPATSARLTMLQSKTSHASDSVPETRRDPNLLMEDLDMHTSPGQLNSNRRSLGIYGDQSGTYSPRFTQASSGMDPLLPTEDNLARQKSKAERIAALKTKAESLQDRIQTESKRLMDNPIVSVQPRIDEIDSILARSGVWSTSPQWLPETTDYRQSKPRWQSSSSWDVPGIDVPDSARSRGGLNDISPSQLPGVAGLRHHVTANAENKKEMDAACKIQSAYRGHVVRRAMDTWKLPSGLSMTEVRRHATSTHNFHCNGEQDFEDDNYISEGPLSLSRSDTVVSDGPENLRSVEEILKEMKEKEYCVADSIPIASTTPEWQREIDYDEQELGSHRNTFLADLESRLDSARSRENSSKRSHVEESKPPWERTGGDKYSLINVFTSKYLRTLKKQGTDDNKPDDEPIRRDPLADVALGVNSNSKSSDREIIDPLSSSISEKISSPPEDSLKSDSSITPRSPDIDVDNNNISSAPHRFASQIQGGKVSYSSSDDEEREQSHTMEPRTSEHKDEIKDYSLSFSDTETDPKISHSPLASQGIERPTSASPFKKDLQPKVFSVLGTNEKKYSPAALEQRMAAELNYQEAVEESLRHLTGVERTQGVSLAQQETVSLAQLLKARQLQHEVEMERLTIKAKEEALEAEEKRREDRMKEERLQLEENLKLQQATRKSLKTQAEAARLTAKAAERLSYGVNRPSDRHDFPDSYSSYSATGTITRQKDSSSSNGSDDSVPISKDNINGKESQPRSPSLMSEHSTTSMRPSDNDSHSSIPEQLPSTEEEDAKQKTPFRKDLKDKSDESDLPSVEQKTTAADKNESSDRSISEDLVVVGDTSEGKDEEDKFIPKKKSLMDKKASTDHPSDSSEYSVCFDETLTEDEIAEISRRVVVPSESHRRHQRRRSPHGTLDKSDISSDDQPSSTRQKTPRSMGTGLDDFSIGPSLSGTAESEFAQFMNTMVRRYMLEEEVRSKHQAAMLKLRERAIKEKTDSELAWLKQQKQQIRNKGEDDKMPPIRKKQRAILLRLKVETDEIKKLQAVRKAASHERKLFLQQQENTLRRSKTRQPEESKDRESGMSKARPRPQGGTSDGQTKSSTPIPKLDLRSSPDADDVSEVPSDLDISSASSVLLKKLKKHIPSKIEERRLTTREQRLLERRKQAEQLIAWKRRLDKEEKKIYDIEKKAISAWEKDSELKADIPYNAEKSTSSARQKSEDAETQHLLKGQDSSIVDESSSAKSPNSENHSSPPPPSHSESSIAEEILQINSGTNSSRSVLSSTHEDKSVQRNQEESSDGTNAEDYSQSFESINTPLQTPRSPKLQEPTPKQEKLNTLENIKSTKKDMKEEPERTGKADSPASTPLLPPYARSDKPVTVQPGKLTGQKDGSSRRKESVESWSDESFSQTQSETEHSDIECRVRALKEELKRRRSIAERLKKEQKRRHKDRLKAQEASLRSQIEAYDVFIRKTQTELTQELDHQLAVSNTSSSAGIHVPVAKPQIRSPRKSDQARQSALRSTTAASVSPEASPRSGSTRPTAAVSFLNKNRTESESSGKSSRSLSFEDDDKTAEESTPNGSIKSLVGSQTSPLPSKQEKLPMSHSHTPSPTTPISDKVPVERPKRLDLTEATATLSKLAKPPSVNGSVVLVGNAQRSQIPVASRTPSTSSSSSAKLPGSSTQTAKSHIPVPVSASLSVSPIQKQVASPPSPGISESYSEDFELSAGSKKNQEDGSIATEDDISEHFSDSSTATDKSNKSEAMLDLSTPSKPKTSDVVEHKDDSLLGVLELAEAKHVKTDEEDEEKTPVISPSETPVMSPRTPTMEQESKQEISPQKFSIGDRVLLAGRESGIVRFIGETDFANGIWVGAELELPKGKNDGSVFNIRYFNCKPKHGLFAPVDRVSLLSPETSPSSLEKDSKESKEQENSTESELSKAISDAAKNFETFVKDLEEPVISTVEEDHGTSINRDRLAEELSNKLLNSLLQDSVTTVLDSHASKQKKEEEIEEQKDDSEQEVTGETSIDDEPALPTPVKNFLEMLSTTPASMEEDTEEEEDDGSVPATTNESLAETFTGDLLADTLSKVLEIRRQRAKKWAEMTEVHGTSDDESQEPKHQRDLDNGREVEEILQDGKPSSRTSGNAEVIGQVTENERDREAPVRPVSPVCGTSQDEVAEEWFDEDFGISDFHKMKPSEAEEGHEEDDIWQDGRLIEVLSSRMEPPPPVFLVPHKQQHILRLIEEAVEYYYSKHLRGELSSDVRIPDFLYKDHPNEVSEKEETDEAVDEEKLDSERNTNQVFKTSLFDLVRELISEIYSTKTTSEEMKSRPPWLKKKTVQRPSYCRIVPKTGEELLTVISKQVSDLLNLQGEVKKLDPKVTMKWGSRKKKDKVDLILIQELREEEPEWTNYDEDETTVKMQLTDTVLDMLISDTVMCLEEIERKKRDHNSAEQSLHITRSAFSDGSVSSGDDHSQ